uniref:DUF4200 domain-containing protein n=1 Tax=Caenorhabditis tropicalis TaxID=1561998 RepID=A0A1I7TPG1_9PELO
MESSQVDRIKRLNRDLCDQHVQDHDEIQELKGKLEEAERQRQIDQSEIENGKTMIETLQKRVDDQTTEISGLKISLEEKRRTIRNFDMRIETEASFWEKNDRKKEVKIRELMKDHEDMTKEFKAICEENDEMTDSMKEKDERLEELEKENEELKKKAEEQQQQKRVVLKGKGGVVRIVPSGTTPILQGDQDKAAPKKVICMKVLCSNCQGVVGEGSASNLSKSVSDTTEAPKIQKTSENATQEDQGTRVPISQDVLTKPDTSETPKISKASESATQGAKDQASTEDNGSQEVPKAVQTQPTPEIASKNDPTTDDAQKEQIPINRPVKKALRRTKLGQDSKDQVVPKDWKKIIEEGEEIQRIKRLVLKDQERPPNAETPDPLDALIKKTLEAQEKKRSKEPFNFGFPPLPFLGSAQAPGTAHRSVQPKNGPMDFYSKDMINGKYRSPF